MRITNNLPAINAQRNLYTNEAHGAKTREKLASGLAINRASDNAAGLAISEIMRSQILGLSQATRNSQDGISMVQTAEGGLSESSSILTRMRELSVQAANGTYTDNDRKSIQDEIDQLKGELNNIANNTTFNNKNLLNGSLNTSVQTGANESDRMAFSIGNMNTSGLGVSALDVTTAESAGKAISSIDSAIAGLSSQRSGIGSIQNHLEHTINNLRVAQENQVAAESRIRDADMAAEMMDLSRSDILSQASTAMAAQANQQPQQVLNLLSR